MKPRTAIRSKPAGELSSRGGFALLITITLLAFLVLLLVSLASLTKVETQVASNTQKVTQARQNALLALNIAVGQLQKHAGADSRVTATSDIIGDATHRNLTGVWNTNNAESKMPAVWLVSGSEQVDSTAQSLLNTMPDPAANAADDEVFLVGDASVAKEASSVTEDEKKQRILVKKQAITAPAGTVPGSASSATVGHYGYWVGDQGVKASIGLPDRSAEVNYGPWATQSEPSRLRQQIGAAANYFRNGGGEQFGFDPQDSLNASGLARLNSDSQMEFLSSMGSSDLGSYRREHYHDLTTAAYSVLANTLPVSAASRGLLKDLSIRPNLLGGAFEKYAAYGEYMQAPESARSIRRYYNTSAPLVESGEPNVLPEFSVGVAPVMTEFLLRFRVSRHEANKAIVQTKLYVAFWNPYTSALVPSDLTLEITGLPTITMTDKEAEERDIDPDDLDLQSPAHIPFALRADADSEDPAAMKVVLRFDPTVMGVGSPADKANWLPGRSYRWSTSATAETNVMQFYQQNSDASGAWTYVDVPQLVGGRLNQGIKVDAPAVTDLKIVIKNAAGEIIATCHAPDFPEFHAGTNSDGWKFAYAFRLDQPSSITTERPWPHADYDIRSSSMPKHAYVPFTPNGDFLPSSFASYVSTEYWEYLLYRNTAATANNDAPLFELPRLPILSLGELQHMPMSEGSMFSIGNSWGGSVGSASVNANAVFDRFFFSGLTTGSWGPDLSRSEPLPNWNMRAIDVADVAALRSAGEFSSGHLLQGGGFNINSTSKAAWRAILSRTRFSTAEPFAWARLASSGTQANSNNVDSASFNLDSTLGSGIPAPVFLRFSQSAQEVFQWQDNSSVPRFSTQAYRQGVRGGGVHEDAFKLRNLTTDQIELLAEHIVDLVKTKADGSGPFVSLSQFLNASPLFPVGGVNRSLLEKAIADAAMNPAELSPDEVTNASDPGFSALTVTQADILNGLAPYLRTRSDTFVIRTYGDAANPVTGEIEGRAYAEALVQRLPAPVEPSDAIDQPSGSFGRRFKIVSFRWLSSSEI